MVHKDQTRVQPDSLIAQGRRNARASDKHATLGQPRLKTPHKVRLPSRKNKDVRSVPPPSRHFRISDDDQNTIICCCTEDGMKQKLADVNVSS